MVRTTVMIYLAPWPTRTETGVMVLIFVRRRWKKLALLWQHIVELAATGVFEWANRTPRGIVHLIAPEFFCVDNE